MEKKTIEIIIPETLEDIRLYQYQKYTKVDTENLTDAMLTRQLVKIFGEIINPDVLDYTTTELLTTNVLQALSKKGKLVKKFTLDGIEFGLIPNFDDITLGEYIDIDESIGTWDTFHRAMAVLYRPIVKTSKTLYSIEVYENTDKYSELMKQATMDVCYGVIVFFWTIEIQLLKHSLQSTQTEIAKNPKIVSALGETLIKNMDGLESLTTSVEETLLSLMPSLVYPSPYAYISLATTLKNKK